MDVFVFGSNTKGIHGVGSALHARRHWGAVLGVGEGMTGRAYALPTKQTPYQRRPLADVEASVERFLAFAKGRPEDRFLLTKVGCGRAGFTEGVIAALFAAAPENVVLIDEAGVPLRPASRWHREIGT